MNISFSLDARAVLAQITTADRWMGDAIAKTLDEQNQFTIGVIQRNYLSGPRPAHLGVITNRLRSSINAPPARNAWPEINSAIGTNVKYAGIHEFGGTVKRVSKPGTVRLRTDAKGNLLMRGNLATFARAEHKRVREIAFAGGREYTITYPARPFIQPGIADRVPWYERELSNAVVAAWNGRN